MVKRHIYILPLVCGLLFSCNNQGGKQKNNQPIVLGDSSTIVTETDSSKLRDMVQDLNPDIPSHTVTDTPVAQQPATPPAADTAAGTAQTEQTTPSQQPAASAGKGLTIAFKQVTVFIPNITTRPNNRDLQKANGATYQLTGGNINGNALRILSGNVSSVSMRYQTMLSVKLSNGNMLPLDDLNHTTNWKEMKGSNNVYPISGLTANRLETAEPSAAQLRRAIEHAARRHRLSRTAQRELERDARNLSRHRLPVTLRAVMWKIDGKDASGHTYSKQVRMDM